MGNQKAVLMREGFKIGTAGESKGRIGARRLQNRDRWGIKGRIGDRMTHPSPWKVSALAESNGQVFLTQNKKLSKGFLDSLTAL
jgi:hypothetical protein